MTNDNFSTEDDGQPGLRPDEIPYRPALRLQSAATLALLPPVAHARGQEAMAAIVANLLELQHQRDGRWLFYSRDANHYVGLTRYAPAHHRRRTVIAAVEALEAAGLIEHEPTAPSPFARLRSRLRATPALEAAIAELDVRAVVRDIREPVILRDADRRLVPYIDTAETRRIRKDVKRHNTFLRRFAITVAHPEAHVDNHGLIVIGEQRIDPTRTAAYRVFNGDFNLGGRWYGGFWQQLPARVRSGLLVNGEPTVELDFRACHLRLLAAMANIDLPDGDPYTVPGFVRRDVKLAFNVMVNAASRQSAHGALTGEFLAEHGTTAADHARAVMTAVEAHFPALAPYWSTGVGLRLQNLDADICARVQRKLRQRGIPCLSVHDSFVAPASEGLALQVVMDEAFDDACERLRNEARHAST